MFIQVMGGHSWGGGFGVFRAADRFKNSTLILFSEGRLRIRSLFWWLALSLAMFLVMSRLFWLGQGMCGTKTLPVLDDAHLKQIRFGIN